MSDIYNISGINVFYIYFSGKQIEQTENMLFAKYK